MGFLDQPLTIQSLFGKKRTIGPVNVQTIVNESTVDTLTITKQPIQVGASITDHAFMEPTSFSNNILFSANLTQSLATIYTNLQTLQSSRIPFDVITPKRIYHNMLLTSLGQTTDRVTENVLAIHCTFTSVIFVTIAAGVVPRSRQKNPGTTGATQAAGKKSFLFIAAGN